MNTSHTPVPVGHRPARQRAYSGQARSYDRDTGAFRPYRRQLVEALPLDRGQVVLDVGCGTGLCSGLLREKVGPRGGVVGIEESPQMAAVACERIAREGWRNVTVVVAGRGCPDHPGRRRRLVLRGARHLAVPRRAAQCPGRAPPGGLGGRRRRQMGRAWRCWG